MVPLTVVDAFTDKPFAGNPAAVCFLKSWPADEWLQLVAREMNLSETAFLVRREGNEFELAMDDAARGSRTVRTRHARRGARDLGKRAIPKRPVDHVPHTQERHARRDSAGVGRNRTRLPREARDSVRGAAGTSGSAGTNAVAVGRNEFDYLVELASEAEVRALRPDFGKLVATECRGVIVTAKATDSRFDFVSRFFAPQAGINEDPVTGSAHCCLSEWWGEKLGKSAMIGYQASERGGVVKVTRDRGRVKLAGKAVTVTRGELLVPML